MTSYLLAGPAQEPVSLARAKAFLRIDDDIEDGFIGTLITAGRLHIEGVTGKALIAQTWRLVLDCWPPSRVIKLPMGPMMSLVAVTAYDDDGEAHALDVGQFIAASDGQVAQLLVPSTMVGMPLTRDRQGLEIDYVAGFDTEPDAVPADMVQALLVLVGYWFEHRDAVIIAGSGALVPSGFDRLVAPHRQVRL